MNTRVRTTLTASLLAAAALASTSSARAASTYSISDQGGNSDFNGSYQINGGALTKTSFIQSLPASVQAAMASIYPDDYVLAYGGAEASATAFGKSGKLLSASAKGYRWNGQLSASYDLEVMGTTVVSGSGSTIGTSKASLSTTFFSAQDTYYIEGLPIFVSVSVTGDFGLDVAGSVTSTSTNGLQAGLRITLTPKVGAYVTGNVGFGWGVASAGVTGDLTAIELDAPIVAKALFSSTPGVIDYTTKVNATLQSFDGSLGLYASAAGHTATWNFVNWNGYTWVDNLSLFNQSGTLPL